MKSLALVLFVLLGTTRAMACSVEQVSWNMHIMQMIASNDEVRMNARKMGGITAITEKENAFWVSHETCSFNVKPVLKHPKHVPGGPAGCPSVVGLEVSAQIDCAFPR